MPNRDSGAKSKARRATRKGSPFDWTNFRQPLVAALDAGTAEAFCIGQRRQLTDAINSVPYDRPDPQDLRETFDSLILMLEWWLPARPVESAEQAAQNLSAHIADWVLGRAMGYEYLADRAQRDDVKRYEQSDKECRRLSLDPVFLARIAARLVSYDPKAARLSPQRTLREAVYAEVEAVVGPFPGGRTNPKSFGVELKRLFALPAEASARARLEDCVAKLSDEEREFVQTMYRGGSSKMLAEGRWGGTRRTQVGRTAKTSLLKCMPELATFAMPDLARFAAGKSAEEN